MDRLPARKDGACLGCFRGRPARPSESRPRRRESRVCPGVPGPPSGGRLAQHLPKAGRMARCIRAPRTGLRASHVRRLMGHEAAAVRPQAWLQFRWRSALLTEHSNGGSPRYRGRHCQTLPAYSASLTRSNQSAETPLSCSAMAICDMAVVSPPPCQCFSPGRIHTTSP